MRIAPLGSYKSIYGNIPKCILSSTSLWIMGIIGFVEFCDVGPTLKDNINQNKKVHTCKYIVHKFPYH